ncbi:MAG: Crp/Fnr family transcriptional regulator [Myxococcota bacterium]|nr:Crp/Fnr family transcriptional regulator [Myxococcota bacterium]
MGRREDTGPQGQGGYERSLEPGEAVFDQGDPGDHLYVIRAGEIELVREGDRGERTVARLGPGDFFGELSLVAGQPYSTRALAVSATRVLALDRETLEALCVDQPEIAIRMVRVLVSRLIEAERRLALLGADDLLGPVVRALVRQAEPVSRDAGAGFRVVTTLRRLADTVGLSMLETHRALQQLFDRTLVHLVEDGLRVPDLEALSACLDASEPGSLACFEASE